MVKIGRVCTLEVVKFTESGAYLDGGPYGEILLPNRYVCEGLQVGDEETVFVSFDSEDRLFASTQFPLAMVGELGFLKVLDISKNGTFLDWGMPKDLFVPFREQHEPMEKGSKYFVRVYVDTQTGRIVASSKINRFLDCEGHEYQVGQQVRLLIARKTDLGYTAIIEHKHTGVLYANEVFARLNIGDQVSGYIKKIRPDGKLDLSLQEQGYKKVEPVSCQLMDLLQSEGGFLPYTDKTDPDTIQKVFGTSKKTFKQALGALFKNRQIRIEQDGIFLLK